MEHFTYPGLGPAAANPWAFLQQQPGLQQQLAQQPQFPTTGAAASLGAPAGGGRTQAMSMLPGLMQQHMQQQQQQQQVGAWGGMQGCQLPANFMPNGLSMPDGGGARGNGYPAHSAAALQLGGGGQLGAYGAIRGQGGLPFGAAQHPQEQRPGHQPQAMLQQQAYGGGLHPALQQGQAPLLSLHGGGVPAGFMPQPHFGGGGGGGSTMVPSAMVQSGLPEAAPPPGSKAGGGARAGSSPLKRQPAERQEAGGSRPRQAPGLPPEGGRRQNAQIEPHGWPAQVVWAKLAKYPWWPAQVLAEGDPYIPAGSEAPRRGAVPVRFFGTYDFSWIESQRMLQPFQEGLAEKARQPDEDGFAASVQEAQDFLTTGRLPEGFELALLEQDDDEPQPSASPPKPKPAVTSAKRKASTTAAIADSMTPKAPKPRNRAAAKPQARKRDAAAVQEQLQEIRHSMALDPPVESPFADVPCLDGLLQLAGEA